MKTPRPVRISLALLALAFAASFAPDRAWADSPLFFHTVPPCRLLDTRTPAGAPALQGQVERLIQVTGLCGVPAGAKAVALNITVTQATAGGSLRLSAGDVASPSEADEKIAFQPNKTKANNGVVNLSADGKVKALALTGVGQTVHLILDVTGFFLESQNVTPTVSGGPFSLAENSANGTSVGTVTATDPDVGQTHAFAITAGNTGGAFAINAATGEITVASSAALDFETTPTFSLTVTATDNGTPPLTGSGTVVVNLTDVNEAPAPSGGPFTIAESSTNGTSVGTVAAGDPDAGQTHTFAITSGNTGGVFAINAATGEITVANAALLDAETTPSYSLTVQATDNGTPVLSGSTTVVVNVTDTNEQPVPSGGPFSLAENSANGTVVGTVTVTDPDVGQTHTFALTAGNTGGAFAINATTGQITVATSAALDFETTPTFNLTVTATDNGTPVLSGSTTVVVNLTDVNEAPAPTGGPFSVAENSPNGTSVGTVAANDPDAGQTQTFAITAGNTGGAFAINAATGAITVANSAALDFDTTPTFNLTVQVTDNGTPVLSGSTTVVINLTDVNEAPAPTGGPFSLAENSANGTVVGTVAANDPDAGQTQTFAITAGNTGGAFAINASTGQITVANSAALDFETTPTFNLTVQATDNGTPVLSGSTTVVVNLTNVNEAPAPSGGPFSLAENSANGTVVGTVAAGDPDAGQTHTFAITAGNTGGAFAINASTGQITVASSAALDFETNPSFSLTVQVTDNGTPVLSGSTTVVINLTDVNEAPVVSGGPFSVPENSANGTTVGTVTFTDSDTGQTHTFAITAGNTGGAFAINPSTGVITVANSAALNFETTPTFNLTVQVTDNGTPVMSGSTTVTINLTDVNEPPTPAGGPFSVAENSANGTVVGTVTANDPDTGQTLTFAITAGNTGGAFAINASTGQITVANSAALDFETNPTFSLTVQVTDNGTPVLSGSTTVTINLTNVNEPPTNILIDNASISENQSVGAAVGNFSTVDPDAGDTFVYALVAGTGSTDNGSFTIVGNQLRAAISFNYEVKNSYSIRVRSTDQGGTGLSVEKVFTITILDVPEPPMADDDPFNFVGNTELRVDQPVPVPPVPNLPVATPVADPKLGVLDGDSDPEGGTLTVSRIIGCADLTAPYDCTLPSGARVIMESDGKFSYIPAPGAAPTSDTFQYEVKDPTNLPATGTVNLTRWERVWYVKNNSAAGGLGRSNDPFDTLAEAQTASVVGDYIFVHLGDGAATGQSAGIALKSGQHLLGEHAGLSVPVNSVLTSLFAAAAGSRPKIDNTGGSAVSITDAIPTEIWGVSLLGSVNAIDWTTNAAFATTGALTVKENIFRGAGAEGVDVNAGGTGTLTFNFQNNTWDATGTHTGNAVDIARTNGSLVLDFNNNTGILSNATAVNINGGAVASTTIKGFANNTVHASTLGSGISVANATFNSNPGGPVAQVMAGSSVIGASGNGVGASGLVLNPVAGNLFFTDLDVFADNGAGVRVTGTGSMTFGVSPSVAIVEATGGPAVDVTSVALTLPLSSLKSTNSTTTGVALNSITGSFSAGSGSAITGSTGTGFQVGSSNATVSYDGTITTTTGKGVDLTSNTGSTIGFTGALSLSSGGQPAFTATGGGTVTTTNTTSTLTTSTGTALNVANTTIGSGGLKFRSISAGTAGSGPTNGIVLNTTGALGGLTVSGTGSAGTGGTIRKAATGISLTSTRNVSLAYMQLNDFTDFAIRGSSVVNFTMDNTVINGVNGDDAATDDGCIRLTELTGSATISNSNISGGAEDNVAIVNTTGTLNRLTLNNTTVGANSTTQGGDGLFVEAQGSAVINVTVQSSFFTSSRGDLAQFTQGSTGSMDVVVQGTAFSDNHPAIVSGGGGVVLGGTAGSMTFNVNGNTFRDATGTALAVSCGNAGQSCVGRLENNQVGLAATANSGSTGGSGIAVVSSGGGTLTALVNNNQVRQYNNHGILVQAGQTLGNATNFSATVTNNTISNPGTINTNFNGIHLNNGTVPGENFTSCVDIRNNSIAGSGTGTVPPNNADYRLRQRQSTTVRLPGYGGANNNDAAVVTFVSGNQTTVTTGASSNTVGSGGGGFVGGASCPTPP